MYLNVSANMHIHYQNDSIQGTDVEIFISDIVSRVRGLDAYV